MKQRLLNAFSIVSILLIVYGCVDIPQEAPELSSELGKRIAAIEESHIALLRKYIDEKRKKVDDFIKNEWTPLFAENYFKQPNISKVWDQVVVSGDTADRLKLLTLVGPKLQERINIERLKLIKPLDEIEKEVERKLRDEYRQAKAINNSITSYLASASKVAENRDRLLEIVGIEDEKIRQAIADADKAVESLVESKDTIEERFKNFKESIESARNALVDKK
jgi:soluble cytochrome b562